MNLFLGTYSLRIACIFVFLVSTTFHAVQIRHEHHGSTHSHAGSHSILMLGEYMHVSDKKQLLGMIPLALVVFTVIILLYTLYVWRVFTRTKRHYAYRTRLFDYHGLFLSRGILNPKTF